MARDDGPGAAPGAQRPGTGLIRWDQAAEEIDRQVAAAAPPAPGAFTFYRSRRLFVRAGAVAPVPGPPRDLPGGTVLAVEAEGLVVMTGHGAYRILRCRLEGEEEQSGGEFGRDQALGPGGFVGVDS